MISLFIFVYPDNSDSHICKWLKTIEENGLFLNNLVLQPVRLRIICMNILQGKEDKKMMDSRALELLTSSFFKILIPGLTMTIPLTVISFCIGLIIAVLTALTQFADVKILNKISKGYIWIIRGTPLLVQLYVIFFGLPGVGVVIAPFPAAVLVFSINQGAYMSEIVRGALGAVPYGQIEAGYCVGMSYFQIMKRIVLPQAFHIAFPSLSNSLIALVKDTSLAANITVAEMFMMAQRIVARTYEPLILYVEVGIIYLIFSTVLTIIQHIGERKLNFHGY